jgi:hypothetical protein
VSNSAEAPSPGGSNRYGDKLRRLADRGRLPLSSATLDLVSALIRGHLKKIGSRRRKLPPGSDRLDRPGGSAP